MARSDTQPLWHEVIEAAEAADAYGTVLLLGSLGSSLDMWDPQVGPLRERHRLVRVDLRGHGRSPVPPGPYSLADLGGDVLALMDRLGIERADVCGLSLGGMVAMWLAIAAPERVRRLVLLCTSARLEPAQGWVDRAALVRAHGTGAVADAVVGRWFTPAFALRHPDLVARMRAMVATTPAEGYAGCCEAIASMDLRPGLGSIGAPTLCLAGADDPAIPPAHLRAIADVVPGARLEVLPDAAHLANVEQAERVNAAILEHLGQAEHGEMT